MGKLNRFELTDRQVRTIKTAGRHSDGEGLFLQVGKKGAKSWIFLFQWQGRRREMGLGSLSAVGLVEARKLAGDARGQVAAGIDPIAARDARLAEAIEAVKAPTFREFGLAMIDVWRPGWKNEKHIDQWRKTVVDYCAGIADLTLDQIGTDDVLKVLQPIWLSLPETASRVRGRIERILDAGKVKGLRAGENPAVWRGHLKLMLSKPRKLTRGRQAAMERAAVPEFVARLRKSGSVSALAMEFLILTWARTGEVRLATWSEIDLRDRVWTVPPERMKSGREHRVPLVDQAVAILDKVKALGGRPDGFIFPGGSKAGCLSNMAMAMLLRGMHGEHATVHGFRAVAKTWAYNETNFAREISEAALAHSVGDDAEKAYKRSDALDRRRKLMAAWAMAIEPKPAGSNVTPLSGRTPRHSA